MIPAPRLRLKRSTGWFAAGQEMATALPLLSDAALKLYVFLCLNVDRHRARMVWEPMELAHLLQRDRQRVADALEELCRREVGGRCAPAGWIRMPGSPSSRSRWRSSTASGLPRSPRWRSLASPRTAMFSV